MILTKENFIKVLNRLEKTSTCWTWRGSKKLKSANQTCYVHRFFYERYHEVKLDRSTWVIQKCNNKNCVNPNHLEAGNAKKICNKPSIKKNNFQAKKTHCKAGHELIKPNIYNMKKGNRVCRICCEASRKRSKLNKELANERNN